ncbi:SPOR domain-containing protein [Carnimonas bestiolae]|uniref:SPOR domain-containing protein n=1 Tax=Carnimonas bestiolae TaxID=3402172 RepID=UPI003EDBA81B
MPPRQSNQGRRPSQAQQQRRANGGHQGNNARRGASQHSGGGWHIPGWAWIIIGLAVGVIATKVLMGGSGSSDHSDDAAIVTRPIPTNDSQQQDAAKGSASKGDESKNSASSQQKGDSSGKQQANSQSADDAQQQKEKDRMPSFEFYTLLPKSEVIAPSDPKGDDTTISTPPPTPTKHRANNEQAASTNSSSERQQANTNQSRSQQQSSDLGGARYLLQAASYRNRSDADTMAGKFRDLGLVTQVSQVKTGDGTTWYRVQAGPYSTSAELSRARDLMKARGIEPLTLRQR